jgi:AraC family transcriptional regulator
MRYGRTSRISVRRGNTDVPLYPTGAVGIASEPPWPRLVGEKYRLHTLEIPEHEHADFCFHLQTGGSPELEWWWNGKNGLESPKPGALMLLPPGTTDRLRWAGASDRFVISLEAKFVREVANEVKSGLDPSFHTRWHFRDEPLRELLGEIGREASDGWALGTLYADMLGLSLTTLLLKRHATTPPKLPFVRGGLSMKAIKASLEFITDNLHRDLHLTEIASVVGLSPFHFVRLFKAATGQTPYQYLLEQRLRRAKEFLRFGSLPVSEIGTEVGFPNHAHFARSFRKREGITPTAWRRSQSV